MSGSNAQGGRPPALATTIFGTRPDDVLATVDVYTAQATTAINNTKNQLSFELAKAVDSVSSGLNNPNLLSDLFGKALGDEVSQINAVANLVGALGGDKTALADLKKGALDNLLGGVGFMGIPASKIAAGLLGVPGGLTPKEVLGTIAAPEIAIYTSAERYIRKLEGEYRDLDAQGIAGLLTSMAASAGLSNFATAFDLTSQLTSVQNILAWTTYFRIPELIDLVRDTLQAEEDRRRVFSAIAMKAAEASDMYTLGECVDIVGAEALMHTWPTLINVFLSSYKFPDGSDCPIHSDALALAGLLSSLNPHWNQYRRDGTWVTNLEPYANCNSQARDSFMMLDAHYVQAMVSTQYPQTSMLTIARGMYPHTPISQRTTPARGRKAA